MSTTARTLSGDLVFPRQIVTDPASVARQTCVDVLGLWQQSWFLDLNGGFPWIQQILGAKNPSTTLAKALLRQAILAVPYVIDVTVQVFFNPTTRQFAWSFQAPLDTGEVLTGGSGQAFHVQPVAGAN